MGMLLIGLIALVVVVGVGAGVSELLTRSRGRQLASGDTPRLPAKQGAVNVEGGAHVVVHLHPGAALAAQLREHANAAEARGLRPFFEFGAMWCPPSRMFGEILDDPRMHAALAGVYLIRAELDDFMDDPRTRELRAVSVPVFYELDADGQSTGRTVNGGAWGADTTENMSSTMARFFAG